MLGTRALTSVEWVAQDCVAVGAGLPLAIWGHVSDGNLHANVIPDSLADVERGREAIMEIAGKVMGWAAPLLPSMASDAVRSNSGCFASSMAREASRRCAR